MHVLSAIPSRALALAVDVCLHHRTYGTCSLPVSSNIQGLPDFRRQCMCVGILHQDVSRIHKYIGTWGDCSSCVGLVQRVKMHCVCGLGVQMTLAHSFVVCVLWVLGIFPKQTDS